MTVVQSEEERCAQELKAAMCTVAAFANKLVKLGWFVEADLLRDGKGQFDPKVTISKRVSL